MTESEEAARLVGAVRDDPGERLRLAASFYDSPAISAYRHAEVAFMQWQIRRGVLNADGSPWWRAVNESLLRDAAEAALRARSGSVGGSDPVRRWGDFLHTPSPRTWYRAHNSSIVAGYLAHRDLVDGENLVERFFLDVALLRVLYADCLLSAPRRALGWLAPAGPLLGDPRRRSTAMFLSLRNILPATYPLAESDLNRVLEAENYLGRLVDYGTILPRARVLYEHAAEDLGEPRLLELIHDGAPAYAWPVEHAYAWVSRRPRATRLVQGITGPRR